MSEHAEDLLRYRLAELERKAQERDLTVEKLAERIDKLTLAVVGFALTLAVFGLGIAVTLLTTRS